ncbi:hypothetical protein DHEL01_v201812 [Diaporthe helianthi]|uniref:Uncharacterized protein n=1 Tax=Diaporthe helianthi TaxID=158607 RepID=A0A2P5IBC5_DIAHE|nr:hypothetical protein DHEL01_v201812 [Diaporthe helianthi]
MMEGRDYADDDEGLFRFDNDEDEAAFLSNLNEDDLMEPLTPVGSAEPVIAPALLHHAAAAAAAGGSGGPHSNTKNNNFSSVNAWQHPEPASPPPPPLSYSPSPSTTPAMHHRPAGRRRRLSSRRSRQSQLSHQGTDQSLAEYSHLPAPVPASTHHEDLQQLDARTLQHQHQPPVQDQVDDDGLMCDDAQGQIQGQGAIREDEPTRDELRENGFVEIDADGVQAMFNGNEADRITAQKFQSEVLKTVKQNGKVVYMVGQATAQWWLSSEMQKRRRAAARRMLDIGGAVASSAGNVIMNNTPIGGVVTTVSDNVTAFKAAPFLYTMQGLGIMKKEKPNTSVLSPTTTHQRVSNDGFLGPDEDRHFAPSPAIVQDEDEDDMLGVLNFDDADDI